MRVLVNNKSEDYKVISIDDDTGVISAIDQRKLPFLFTRINCLNLEETCKAIKNMVVRGGTLIGITAIMAFYQALIQYDQKGNDFQRFVIDSAEKIKSTRPTAAALHNHIEKILDLLSPIDTVESSKLIVRDYLNKIITETINHFTLLGKQGAKLVQKNPTNILTICNAGALAGYEIGSALAPIRFAFYENKPIKVYICETRPQLQGARLTAWELHNEGIEHVIISDNAAGFFINKGEIDLVIVGSDRIAINGDFANKIGTYTLSVLCKENNIPFYVAAAKYNFDSKLSNGNSITIEERSIKEMKTVLSVDSEGDRNPKRRIIHNIQSPSFNPAFDVTPGVNVTGFITDTGILEQPYSESIPKYLKIC
ncbi:MAG: S-methyl-5-thioribose-1-phosphate isomerase [Candidatus Heimdallarchaeota archaeon]|nr:S-methyl-5-thioribose-1-phosphate isomerase [Candidatus Heimdallarchaeota archaeon]